MNRVIIIGAGASGLMAGLVASENGADVTILERNDKIGKKLLATGNGRCNYSNVNTSIENFHGRNSRFAYSAFSQFDVYQAIYFFESIGITPRIEESGKVFPASLQSSSMIDVFLYEIEKRNIKIEYNTRVEKIYHMNDFKVEASDGRRFSADKLIVATGGKSLPTSGSDGSGYKLLENFGHSITEVFPGIVQLHLKDRNLRKMSGVRIDARAELYINDQFIMADSGDVLFTDYGISGPTILQLSRRAIDGFRKNKKVEIGVNVIVDMNGEEIYEYLLNRFNLLGSKSLEEALIGFINKKLILALIEDSKLDPKKLVSSLSKDEIRRLAENLACWKFRVTGHQPWEFAQVTAGGIDTDQVDNKTMESKKMPGLYVIGELLDIDGDCGGFNLQWAWSSGYVAGLSAAID